MLFISGFFSGMFVVAVLMLAAELFPCDTDGKK